MRIDRSERIGDQPIKKVRDFLRRLDNSSWNTEKIAGYFDVEASLVTELVAELCRRGLLEKMEPWREDTEIFYQQGTSAPRLTAANLLKPINRERADKLIKELLERVTAVNADNSLVYEVAEVRVFGSYLDPTRLDLGDIDLAIALVPRAGRSQKDVIALSLARAAASGRRFSNYIQELFYGQHEVLKKLKARTPYLSIHTPDDLDKIGADSSVIFKREVQLR